MTLVLGIETSCDETSAAVVEDGQRVLSNIVASQIDLHARYGGVVPEIASRAHVERLDAVLREALQEARADWADIGAIAVTNRPGLLGALLIGVTAAKTLSWVLDVPLVAVDHIHAHAHSAALAVDDAPWPAIALVASGGHTSLYHVRHALEVELLGATVDDAAGEAFDKVSAILGLGYPGGPKIERAGRDGRADAETFPRTMLKPGSLDFSFSGIKTAVLYRVHGHGRTEGGLERLSSAEIADIAASFEQAVVDVLVAKTMRAVKQTGAGHVVLGGGVAANGRLRRDMAKACEDRAIGFVATPMSYCTDNAAMIAALGYHQWRQGDTASLAVDAHPTGYKPD